MLRESFNTFIGKGITNMIFIQKDQRPGVGKKSVKILYTKNIRPKKIGTRLKRGGGGKRLSMLSLMIRLVILRRWEARGKRKAKGVKGEVTLKFDFWNRRSRGKKNQRKYHPFPFSIPATPTFFLGGGPFTSEQCVGKN